MSGRAHKYWEVEIGGLSAGVDQVTGKIAVALRMGRARPKRTDDRVMITGKTANQNAAKYFAAAGISLQNAKLVSSKPFTPTNTPGHMQWEVQYVRTYHCYPFIYDYLLATLDPLDGSLLGFGSKLDAPLPATTELKLTKDQAVAKAREYFAGLGITAGNVLRAEPKIVQPDNYWEYQRTHQMPTQSNISRLAWEIVFDAPAEETIIWIDGENGKALGGYQSRGRGPTQGNTAGAGGVK